MTVPAWRYLYGPVPSRRLGRSLGVDLIPHKICSFDCVYCQLGRTTCLTTRREEYVPAEKVLTEMAAWLRKGGTADWLTFSGAGEPTLHAGLGSMIRAVKEMSPLPVAVITNGSLLADETIRTEVCAADLILPSLDAGTATVQVLVNRPAPEVKLQSIREGLRLTREQCVGEMWLEIMLVQGYNDSEEELQALREAVDLIRPHRVQINTVVRPPAESGVRPLDEAALRRARELLGPPAEVIAPWQAQTLMEQERTAAEAEITHLLRRRPCTLTDIAGGLGLHPNEVLKYLEPLVAQGTIRTVRKGEKVFYAA